MCLSQTWAPNIATSHPHLEPVQLFQAWQGQADFVPGLSHFRLCLRDIALARDVAQLFLHHFALRRSRKMRRKCFLVPQNLLTSTASGNTPNGFNHVISKSILAPNHAKVAKAGMKPLAHPKWQPSLNSDPLWVLASKLMTPQKLQQLSSTCSCLKTWTALKLDDGWPESVEEQGLLLLVWRHRITNKIFKMCYRQSRRGVSRQNSRSARQ